MPLQQVLLGLLGIRPDLPEYFVEIAEITDSTTAIATWQGLENDYSQGDFQVFKPSAEIDEYIITLGGQVTLSQALELLDQAEDRGIPGADLRRIPR